MSQTPSHSSALLLKDGADLPVFLIHGMRGSAEEFLPVTERLKTPRRLYALRAKGHDGRELPLTRIEDMSAFYLDTIKTLQPQGPYSIVGYSLGGLTAIEIARTLEARGESVVSLVLIDSYPFTRTLSPWKSAKVARLKWKYRISDAMLERSGGSVAMSQDDIHERMEFSDFVALTNHQVQRYEGKIEFVRAADSTFPDPNTAWPHLTPNMKIGVIPGDHHSILSKDSAKLAELLSSYLESATRSDPARKSA